MKPHILITGGAGFIGGHLAQACQSWATVRVLDDLSSGKPKNLAGCEVDLHSGSILDSSALKVAMHGIDVVFHLAAFVSVPASMEQPAVCARLNVEGTLKVLEAAEIAGVNRLVFASSAAVYGDDPVVPKVETMPPAPRSPYALTKYDGEFYCGLFHQRGRLRTVCARFFNVFGPRQDPNSAYAAAVPRFVTHALAGHDLIIFGDGEQTRDFVYVRDVADGLIHLARHPELTGVFNVGYGAALTINELADEIIRLTGSSSKIRHEPPRPGDVKHSVAAVDRLRATGWRPQFTIASGLAEMVQGGRWAVDGGR
jgi:UDP-glucose 4-epimerase